MTRRKPGDRHRPLRVKVTRTGVLTIEIGVETLAHACLHSEYAWQLTDPGRTRCEVKACGAKLDPIQVLRDYARHERNFCYSLEHLRKEQRDLSAEIKKLKALRARLRAEARKSLPPVEARPGDRKWRRDMVANAQLNRVLAQEPSEGEQS